MKHCPITYEEINDNENYSHRGLRLLSLQLKDLKPLELSAEEQRSEAIARVGKMSIQGVQSKLSAQLKIKETRFEIVDRYGQYILKPQSSFYPELPENEALTMSLATKIKINVPVHGLVISKDKSWTYFIKRFDRIGHNKKLAVEDFAQLLGASRHTKYDASMERVISVIERFCTFPKIEFVNLFKLMLFNFLVGNEDMHLKNFSLITENETVMLSPAYDLLNSTIAQTNAIEEMALPLNGRKNNLRKKDFLSYLGIERLGLNSNTINGVLRDIQQALPIWQDLISNSFLSKPMQEKYHALLSQRSERLGFQKLR